MNNQLSDEKVDQIMRSLTKAAAIDEATVEEIAGSPAIWRSVQARIDQEQTARAPWPPVNAWRRWLMIGVPAAAAIAVVAVFFVYKPVTRDVLVATSALPADSKPAMASPESTKAEHPTAVLPPERRITKARFVEHRGHAAKTVPTPALPKTSAEIKTDFIALSYARDPESGQLVRVRVPSSMMVTLGVVATVKRPTDMVDAEVLVGDDGLTRAIRFIHKP